MLNGSSVALKQRALMLLASGLPPRRVAKKLKQRSKWVYALKQDPEFAAALENEIEARNKEFRDEVRSMTRLAFRTLKSTMLGDNANAAVRAALAILQSTGAIREPEKMAAGSGKIVVEFGNLSPSPIGAANANSPVQPNAGPDGNSETPGAGESPSGGPTLGQDNI